MSGRLNLAKSSRDIDIQPGQVLEFLSKDNQDNVRCVQNRLGPHVAIFHRGTYPVHWSSSIRVVSPEKRLARFKSRTTEIEAYRYTTSLFALFRDWHQPLHHIA